ncbi:DUF192 domain-containing protein [Accumulibacter sp.]|uniref:DUF192 domain-containing protein n=1 Tax=Accumulibacter sp. TaxID=2053492 RepID=UPI0025EBE14E|nr:DUF192 domain-containing protein [Accumulibacter sp.]MCM8613551.1 DUF192 domain-containing protein [Accumulibacter sp.]MCM8637266.1 DUF192 domain-containing protein [Accumulibacter sp.]MCM8638716.1 DUF192 domain-containing protein [Accumulibacter sp.]
MWIRSMLCSGTLAVPLLAVPALAQMPRIELSAGMYRIDAEVAANDATRMQGLMNRRSLPAGQGMLFVFRQPQRHCMWMRNTYVPLSVAFLDRDGHILNIEDMQPESETNHCAARAASFALEMNLGWFADKGIRPGTRIAGIEKSPAPR